MFNIEAPVVHAWVRENEVELRGLTFAVFMARLRGIVLSTDWAWKVAQTLLKKQTDEESFDVWVSTLREANNIFITLPRFHIPSNKLWDHILLHCHDDVRREYALGNKDNCYDNITNLNQWLRTVSDIDKIIASRKSQISRYLADSIVAAGKSQLKNVMNNVKSASTGQTMKATSTGTTFNAARVDVYELTTKEHAIL